MAKSNRRRPKESPDEPRDPYAGEGADRASDSVAEALARARHHGKAAAAEALAAARALVEAASLASGGRPSEASRLLGPLAKLLEHLSNELGVAGGEATPRILEAVAEAVDEEIGRWQARARDDAEARTVLRAFLGLREVLWEMGVRRAPEPDAGAPRKDAPRRPPQRSTSPAPRRIQRVPVQG